MNDQNLLETIDKYSAVSFGFDKNTWSLYEDGKAFVLSVSPKYSYNYLNEAVDDVMENISYDRLEEIVQAVIGDRPEIISDEEYLNYLDHTDEYLENARKIALKVVSNRDFLSYKDNNPYFFSLYFATIHLPVGEGLFNFLYADFDSAFEQCIVNAKKDLPENQTSLDVDDLNDKEKNLYYYVCLTETSRRFAPLFEASFFTAAFPPILFQFTEKELTEYYRYLKKLQERLSDPQNTLCYILQET